MFLNKSKVRYFYFLLILLLAMFTTLGSVHDDKESSTNTVNISGTISVNSETQVDSDVNDPFAPYISNDSIAQAQLLKNPVTVGGFVATSNSVSFGRLGNGGSDVLDYYSISLVAQQPVYFFPGDDISVGGGTSTCKNFDVQILGLCVALEDAAGNAVSFVEDTSNTSFITITPQSSGNYYLRVQAEQGARNYMVATGLPSTNITSQVSSGDKLSIEDNFIPGEVIVKFRSNFFTTASVTSRSLANSVGLIAKAGAPGRSMLMSLGDVGNRTMTFNTLGVVAVPQHSDAEAQLKQDTIEVVKVLRQRADVEYAALNYIRQPLLEPNDRYYGLQWHYPQINLPLAWERTTGNANVTVAVIDSGVLNHPDLQSSLVQGYDFISSIDNSADGDGIDSDPTDPGDTDGVTPSSFHGTHVAGTIAAVSNNTTGVAGVTWNVKVMPLRVCGTLGCSDYDIQQALRYAAGLSNDSGTVPAQPADVINLSLGAPTTSTVAPPAYVAVRNAGVIVVAAAGNESSSELFAPAAYDGVVSVSAVDFDGNLAFYSNTGSTIDVAAPGGDITANLNGDTYPDGILSTVGSDQSGTLELGYGFYQGTSMAAPHVAGVAALMKSVNSGLTPDQFDQWLQGGELTQDLGVAGRDDLYGYGLIDAAKAVAIADGTPIIPELPPGITMNVNPDGLIFTSNVSNLTFEVSDGGQDPLTVGSFTNDSSGWLTVTAVSVDANGVGTYSATVDRTQLGGLATASAVITFQSDATNSPSQIPVVVYTQEITSDAGFHYVLLYDIDRNMVVGQDEVGIVNGQYQYSFPSVPIGNYFIVAGNDSNSDDSICSRGEACGAYATLGNVTKIVVNINSRDLTGINFATGFNPFISEIQGLLSSDREKVLLK
ncbi:S8 family peptidase [Kaarinaea lacus]